MTVVVWHNQRCATSRKVLDIIRKRGIAPDVVAYVKTFVAAW
jgi:arsenate reductase (glutaredoxin)